MSRGGARSCKCPTEAPRHQAKTRRRVPEKEVEEYAPVPECTERGS